MTGNLWKWLQAYLTNRVSVNKTVSDDLPGVPQGSILGPIIFLVLVNDLSAGVWDMVNHLQIYKTTTLLKNGFRQLLTKYPKVQGFRKSSNCSPNSKATIVLRLSHEPNE